MLAARKEMFKAHKLCQTFNKVFSLTHFLIDEDNEPLKIKGNKKNKEVFVLFNCLSDLHWVNKKSFSCVWYSVKTPINVYWKNAREKRSCFLILLDLVSSVTGGHRAMVRWSSVTIRNPRSFHRNSANSWLPHSVQEAIISFSLLFFLFWHAPMNSLPASVYFQPDSSDFSRLKL